MVERPGGIEDPKFRARILWAIAFSIAIHEIIAGLWPGRALPPEAPNVVSVRISIDRPTPKPTPRPTPRPTPKPIPVVTPAPHYTLAPKIVVRDPAAKAAATPTHKLGGAAAQKHIPFKTPPPATPKPAPPVSLVQGTHEGAQNGGAGSGAGAGNGTGGLGGTGTGSGTAGTGTGGDSNTAPCGDVYLSPEHFDLNRDGSYVQQVRVTVRLRDGRESSAMFPYPFHYPNERANPFLSDAGLSSSGGVFLQQPPPGSDVSKMEPTVQTVLAHTDPATGKTTFPECPGAPAQKP
jgi:hypothetical protein